jgi:hypothetical protein
LKREKLMSTRVCKARDKTELETRREDEDGAENDMRETENSPPILSAPPTKRKYYEKDPAVVKLCELYVSLSEDGKKAEERQRKGGEQ